MEGKQGKEALYCRLKVRISASTLAKTDQSMWKGENRGETRERVFNSPFIVRI